MELSLRSRSSEFTEEELVALAALELPTPRQAVAVQMEESYDGPAEIRASVYTGAHAASVDDGEKVTAPCNACSLCSRRHTRCKGGRDAQLAKVTPCTATATALVSDHGTLASDERDAIRSAVPRLSHHSEKRCDGDACGEYTKCLYKTFLSPDDKLAGSDETAEALLRVRHVDLAERQLSDTTAVEIFLNATHVYLSHNNLSDINGLQLLAHLRVLTIDHNEVVSLHPLAALDELCYLDASYNRVGTLLAADDLPCATLRFLDLRHNPCSSSAVASGVVRTSYMQPLLAACPLLEELDGQTIATHSAGRLRSGQDVRDDATQDVALPKSRVRSALQRARLVAASSTLGALSSSSSSLSDDEIDAGVPDELVASAKDTEKQLWRQYVHRAKARRALLLASDETSVCEPNVDYSDMSAGNAHDETHEQNDMTAGSVSRFCPSPFAECSIASGSDDEDGGTARRSREMRQARQMQSKLYADICYANTINHRRLQREIEAHWTNVDRIVQTQHDIANERRCRRERAVAQEPSAAYSDAMRFLTQIQDSHMGAQCDATQR